MNQKKNLIIKVIIIILIIAILAIAGIFIALKFGIFKSNKELFFKYCGNIIELNSENKQDTLKEYIEKKNSVSYKNNGKIDFNTNNFNITFEGENDKKNKYMNQLVKLNYTNDVNFPIELRKVDNLIGAKSDKVVTQFITLDIDNIDDFSNINIEETFENLKDIDFDKLSNYCKEIVNEQFTDEQFEKVSQNGLKGYKLTTNVEQITNTLTKIIEKIQSDEQLKEKIEKIYPNFSIDEFQEQLEMYLEYTNEDYKDIEIKIIVYENGTILFEVDSYILQIQNVQDNNTCKIEINLKNDEDNIDIKFLVEFTGLNELDNITENYNIAVNIEDLSLNYNIENTIIFDENIQKENLDNSIEITQYSNEQVESLMSAIKEQVKKVDKTQMEELGLEKNPIVTDVLGPIIEYYSNKTRELHNQLGQQNLSEEEKDAFNSKFEGYQGNEVLGSDVKSLIRVVSSSNTMEDKNKVIIEYSITKNDYIDGVIHSEGSFTTYSSNEEIEELSNEIENDKHYRIKLSYNENNIVNYITISE